MAGISQIKTLSPGSLMSSGTKRMNMQNLWALLQEKGDHYDPDERYMFIHDLQAFLSTSPPPVLPEDLMRALCRTLLDRCADPSGDVSTLAVKALPIFLKIANDATCSEVGRVLTRYLLKPEDAIPTGNAINADGSRRGRVHDSYVQALREVFTNINVTTGKTLAVDSFTALLGALVTFSASSTPPAAATAAAVEVVKLAALTLFPLILSRFGAALRASPSPLLPRTVEVLLATVTGASETPLARAAAAEAAGELAAVCDPADASTLVKGLCAAVEASPGSSSGNDSDHDDYVNAADVMMRRERKQVTVSATTAIVAIAKKAPGRLAPEVGTVIKALLSHLPAPPSFAPSEIGSTDNIIHTAESEAAAHVAAARAAAAAAIPPGTDVSDLECALFRSPLDALCAVFAPAPAPTAATAAASQAGAAASPAGAAVGVEQLQTAALEAGAGDVAMAALVPLFLDPMYVYEGDATSLLEKYGGISSKHRPMTDEEESVYDQQEVDDAAAWSSAEAAFMADIDINDWAVDDDDFIEGSVDPAVFSTSAPASSPPAALPGTSTSTTTVIDARASPPPIPSPPMGLSAASQPSGREFNNLGSLGGNPCMPGSQPGAVLDSTWAVRRSAARLVKAILTALTSAAAAAAAAAELDPAAAAAAVDAADDENDPLWDIGSRAIIAQSKLSSVLATYASPLLACLAAALGDHDPTVVSTAASAVEAFTVAAAVANGAISPATGASALLEETPAVSELAGISLAAAATDAVADGPLSAFTGSTAETGMFGLSSEGKWEGFCLSGRVLGAGNLPSLRDIVDSCLHPSFKMSRSESTLYTNASDLEPLSLPSAPMRPPAPCLCTPALATVLLPRLTLLTRARAAADPPVGAAASRIAVALAAGLRAYSHDQQLQKQELRQKQGEQKERKDFVPASIVSQLAEATIDLASIVAMTTTTHTTGLITAIGVCVAELAVPVAATAAAPGGDGRLLRAAVDPKRAAPAVAAAGAALATIVYSAIADLIPGVMNLPPGVLASVPDAIIAASLRLFPLIAEAAPLALCLSRPRSRSPMTGTDIQELILSPCDADVDAEAADTALRLARVCIAYLSAAGAGCRPPALAMLAARAIPATFAAATAFRFASGTVCDAWDAVPSADVEAALACLLRLSQVPQVRLRALLAVVETVRVCSSPRFSPTRILMNSHMGNCGSEGRIALSKVLAAEEISTCLTPTSSFYTRAATPGEAVANATSDFAVGGAGVECPSASELVRASMPLMGFLQALLAPATPPSTMESSTYSTATETRAVCALAECLLLLAFSATFDSHAIPGDAIDLWRTWRMAKLARLRDGFSGPSIGCYMPTAVPPFLLIQLAYLPFAFENKRLREEELATMLRSCTTSIVNLTPMNVEIPTRILTPSPLLLMTELEATAHRISRAIAAFTAEKKTLGVLDADSSVYVGQSLDAILHHASSISLSKFYSSRFADPAVSALTSCAAGVIVASEFAHTGRAARAAAAAICSVASIARTCLQFPCDGTPVKPEPADSDDYHGMSFTGQVQRGIIKGLSHEPTSIALAATACHFITALAPFAFAHAGDGNHNSESDAYVGEGKDLDSAAVKAAASIVVLARAAADVAAAAPAMGLFPGAHDFVGNNTITGAKFFTVIAATTRAIGAAAAASPVVLTEVLAATQKCIVQEPPSVMAKAPERVTFWLDILKKSFLLPRPLLVHEFGTALPKYQHGARVRAAEAMIRTALSFSGTVTAATATVGDSSAGSASSDTGLVARDRERLWTIVNSAAEITAAAVTAAPVPALTVLTNILQPEGGLLAERVIVALAMRFVFSNVPHIITAASSPVVPRSRAQARSPSASSLPESDVVTALQKAATAIMSCLSLPHAPMAVSLVSLAAKEAAMGAFEALLTTEMGPRAWLPLLRGTCDASRSTTHVLAISAALGAAVSSGSGSRSSSSSSSNTSVRGRASYDDARCRNDRIVSTGGSGLRGPAWGSLLLRDDYWRDVLAFTASECCVRTKLVHEVQQGPTLHFYDDGLTARMTAYRVTNTILTVAPSQRRATLVTLADAVGALVLAARGLTDYSPKHSHAVMKQAAALFRALATSGARGSGAALAAADAVPERVLPTIKEHYKIVKVDADAIAKGTIKMSTSDAQASRALLRVFVEMIYTLTQIPNGNVRAPALRDLFTKVVMGSQHLAVLLQEIVSETGTKA